jgi:hypothetical protein
MRTTLDLSEDVLLAAKELAARNKVTMGEVISDLARKSLRQGQSAPAGGLRNGFPQLPVTGQAITSELIKSLMDDDA